MEKLIVRRRSAGAVRRARRHARRQLRDAIRRRATHRAAKHGPPARRASERAEPDRAFKRAFDDAAQFDIGLILSDDIGFFIASFGVWPFFMPPFAM